jgi:hypothetical protein
MPSGLTFDVFLVTFSSVKGGNATYKFLHKPGMLKSSGSLGFTGVIKPVLMTRRRYSHTLHKAGCLDWCSRVFPNLANRINLIC